MRSGSIKSGYSNLPSPAGGLGSNASAFLNFVKSMFGAGVLSLPHAFIWSGIAGGAVVYIIAVYLCARSMVLLIRTKHRVLAKEPDADVGTYAALAGHVAGRGAARTVAVAVVVLELAFCTGWVIVFADSVSSVFGWGSRAVWSWLAAPILCGLCNIRWLAQLWPLSFLGVLIYLGGVMGSTVYFVGSGQVEQQFDQMEVVVWKSLPRFAGTAMYGLEAILMALPVESSMAKPHQASWVVAGGCCSYGLISLLFGMLGYAYGLSSCAVVTDCLPAGGLTDAVRLSLATALLISYPVLIFPVTEILEEALFKAEPKPLARTLLRCAQVILTCAVASLCSDFSAFSGVVGALLVPFAGFILPPLLWSRVMPWAKMSLDDRLHQVLLLTCGPLVCVLGIYDLVKTA